MDVNSLFSHGGLLVKNPNYSPNNGQPEYIHNTDISKTSSGLASTVSYAAGKGLQRNIGNEYSNEKLRKYNITPTDYNTDQNNIDKVLYDAQSAPSKIMNSLVQAIGGEFVLGTLKSFGELVDFIGAAANSYKSIYDESGYVKRLTNAQEALKERFPIETLNDVTLGNGALTNLGWYASNLPSVMSTLALLIPSKAITSAPKLITRGYKALKSIDKLHDTSNLINYTPRGARILSKLKLDPITKLNAGTYAEIGVDAAIQRTLENYQESKQTYDEQIKNTMDYFTKDDNFKSFIENNPQFVQSLKEQGIDINSKQEVAREIARQSANKTFVEDYWNIGFDIIQMAALKNIRLFKGIKPSTAKIDQMQRIATENGLGDFKAIKDAEKRSVKTWIKDNRKWLGSLASESTEGIEEAVNYIAQQEGITYGSVLIGQNTEGKDLSQRLSDYVKNPQLWDSFFWGVMGGIVFRAGGSGYNRVRAANQARNLDKEQGKKLKTWKEYFETGEEQVRNSAIINRVAKARELNRKLDLVNQGKNPYISGNPIIENKAEVPYYRNRVIDDYIESLTIDEINVGNYDLLHDYITNPNVKEVLKKEIFKDDPDADTYLNGLVSKMENIYSLYNSELSRLAKMSRNIKGKVPVEYLQNIATTNTQAILTKRNIEEAKSVYAKDLEELLNVPDNKIPENINLDFETYSRLQVITEDLGRTVAQLRALRSNEKELKSINGQQTEKYLTKKINGLIERIDNLKTFDGKNLEDKIQGYNKDVTRLWALTSASKFELVDDKILQQDTDDYTKLLNAITSEDSELLNKYLNEIYGDTYIKSLDINYKDILKNSDGKLNSLYHIFGNTTKELREFMNSHKALSDTYKTLELLNTEEDLVDESRINTNEYELADRLKYLDESAKEIASLAEKEAIKQIRNLVEKYGDDALLNQIFNNIDIENISVEDEAILNDALKILNLSNKTKAYYDKLKSAIFAQSLVNETIKARKQLNDERNDTQFSSTSQKPQNDTENKKQIKSSQDDTKSNTGQEKGKISENTSNNRRKIKLKMSQNGLVFEDTTDNTNDVFNANKDENTENYTLIPATDKVDDALLQNDQLFDDPKKNNHQEGEVAKIETNPIISINNNNNITVVKKGTISYSPSSTGESKKQNKDQSDIVTKAETEPKDNGDVDYSGGYRDSKYEPIISNARNELNNLWYDAIHNKKSINNIEDFFNELKNTILNKYSNELDESGKIALENAVNKSINSFRRLNDSKYKLGKNITNVLASSISETFDGNNDKLLSAIDSLLQTYIRENLGNRRFERDGQEVYLINAEALYRTIYNAYDSKFLVDAVYKLVNDYLATNQNSKYIYTDVDINDPHLLEKVYNEDAKSLLQQEKDEDNIQTIFTESEISDDEKGKRNSILSTIRKGDELTWAVEEREKDGTKFNTLAIKRNGITIGTMAIPEAGTEGGFRKVNQGWKYEITSDGNVVKGKIVDAFNTLFVDNENIGRELFDYLRVWTRKKDMLESEQESLKKKINKLILDAGISTDLMFGTTKEEAEKLKEDEDPIANRIDHLSRILNYLSADDRLTYDDVKDFIEDSLNNWFIKLYNSYTTVTYLIKNPNDYKVTLDNFYTGKLVQPKDKKDRVQSVTYKNEEGKIISKGIADKQNAKLSVIYYDRVAGKRYRISDNGIKEEVSSGEKPGSITVSIFDRMGNEFPLYANSVRFADINIDRNSAAFKVRQAIRDELNKRLNKLSSIADKELESFEDNANNEIEKAYNQLKEFIQTLFYNSYRNPIKLKDYDTIQNSPFLAGGFFGIRSKSNDFYFTEDKEKEDKTKLGLSFAIDHFEVLENGEWTSYDYADNTLKLLQLADNILESTMFNIDYGKINSKIDNSGFFKINQDGVQIVIPSVDGKGFSLNYNINEMKGQNPYTYAILNGGFVKVNTNIDEKTNSNFSLDDKDLMAQQSLKIKVDYIGKEEENKTSPVKGKKAIKEITVEDKATPIITATDGKNKVEELVKLSGYANNIEALKQFNLLPANIAIGKQAKNYTRYAYFDRKNKFYVTQEWIDLFNNPAEGAREEAVRKLIHEQFHYIFSLNSNKENIQKVQKIYDLFKDYVNNHTDAKNYEIGKRYLDRFIDVGKKKSQDALEEFIVESLTSYAFYDYLNNAIIEDRTAIRKKESIFSKILDFLKELFGWKINRNSIFAKEIGLLHKFDINLDNIQNFEPVGEEIKEKPETVDKDIDFTDVNMDDDFEASAISEKEYPSVNDFMKTVDDEHKASMINKKNSGDLSIICKL